MVGFIEKLSSWSLLKNKRRVQKPESRNLSVMGGDLPFPLIYFRYFSVCNGGGVPSLSVSFEEKIRHYFHVQSVMGGIPPLSVNFSVRRHGRGGAGVALLAPVGCC